MALGWLRDKFIVSCQVLGASSGVSLHASSLGRPLLSQVTFRSSLFPGDLHSRVTLHQPGMMDEDLTRISGRIMDSGAGETKEQSITRVENTTLHILSSIVSLKLRQPPSQDGECIFQKKHHFPKSQIYSNDNRKVNNWGKPYVISVDYQALKFFH